MTDNTSKVEYVEPRERQNPWSLRETLFQIIKLQFDGVWARALRNIETRKGRKFQPAPGRKKEFFHRTDTFTNPIIRDSAYLKYWQIESLANAQEIPLFVILLYSRLRADYRDIGSIYDYGDEDNPELLSYEIEKDGRDSAEQSIEAINRFVRYHLPDLLIRAGRFHDTDTTNRVFPALDVRDRTPKTETSEATPRGIPLEDLEIWAREFQKAREEAIRIIQDAQSSKETTK